MLTINQILDVGRLNSQCPRDSRTCGPTDKIGNIEAYEDKDGNVSYVDKSTGEEVDGEYLRKNYGERMILLYIHTPDGDMNLKQVDTREI